MGCKTWQRIQSMLDPAYLEAVLERRQSSAQEQATAAYRANREREERAAANLGITLREYQEIKAARAREALEKIRARREADRAIPAPNWPVREPAEVGK